MLCNLTPVHFLYCSIDCKGSYCSWWDCSLQRIDRFSSMFLSLFNSFDNNFYSQKFWYFCFATAITPYLFRTMYWPLLNAKWKTSQIEENFFKKFKSSLEYSSFQSYNIWYRHTTDSIIFMHSVYFAKVSNAKEKKPQRKKYAKITFIQLDFLSIGNDRQNGDGKRRNIETGNAV